MGGILGVLGKWVGGILDWMDKVCGWDFLCR